MKRLFLTTLLATLLTQLSFAHTEEKRTPTNAPSFLNSSTFWDASPETCSDGISNGDEVDFDGTASEPYGYSNDCFASSTTILTLVTDHYGHEISWTLTGSGTVIASGGCYPNNTTITETFELPDGEYTFTIYDSYGDGICCAYGEGSYTLENDGEEITSGGEYGSEEAFTFCIDTEDIVMGCTDPTAHNYNPEATQDDGSCETCSDGILNGDETEIDCGGMLCEPCNDCLSDLTTLVLRTDYYGYETSWAIIQEGGATVASGANYASNTIYTIEIPLISGDYEFIIADTYGDGICCDYGNGYYTLSNGSTTIASGGAFDYRETAGFCINAALDFAGNRSSTTTTVKSEKIPAAALDANDMGFRVFPNPAQEELNINFAKSEAVRAIHIATATGKVIRVIDPANIKSPIDISRLEAGIYFIAVETTGGVLNQKFTKMQ